MASATLDCPSAKCRAGAKLLGIVQHDGTVGYLHEALAVDAEFVKRAAEGGSPEERFRFANTCAEHDCRHWTGTRCGVSDKVIQHLAGDKKRCDLPQCGLRPTCRWYRQNGLEACAVCSLVITQVV